jgi:hypothetical protein
MTANAAGRRAPAPGLGGTGWLADDLYLMAHDERTGRLVLSPRAAGLGLAGALLADLVLAGCVRVASGQVAVTGAGPPEDGLAAAVLGVLASERPPRPVADWLAFLARTAPGEVAGRLEQAGYLVAVPARPWRAARWRPADPDCAFAPVARVASALSAARERAPGRPRAHRRQQHPQGRVAGAERDRAGGHRGLRGDRAEPDGPAVLLAGTTGGLGIIVLLAATSAAVIAFFARDTRGENPWRRLAAPALAAILLAAIAVLAIQHYAILLGVAPGNPAAWALPASYAAVAVAGLGWALVLRARRPGVYATIGLGPHAVTSQHTPARETR